MVCEEYLSIAVHFGRGGLLSAFLVKKGPDMVLSAERETNSEDEKDNTPSV